MARKTESARVDEVLAEGDRRRSLEALRDELVRRLPNAPDREAVGLSTQLRLILAELDSLGSGEEEHDVVDEIAARRSQRRTDAAGEGGSASAE